MKPIIETQKASVFFPTDMISAKLPSTVERPV